MSDQDKRKHIIRYYAQITMGEAFGCINSILVFFLSFKQFGEWWSYPGLVTGATGIVLAYWRMKVDYRDFKHHMGKLG